MQIGDFKTHHTGENDLALAELVEDAAVAVVEWGDVAPELLGVRRVLIRISPGAAEEERRFELESSELDRAALSAALVAWMIP